MDQLRMRRDPRISAPKMGQYLEAGPGERERIVRNQKFPPSIPPKQYRYATDVVRAAFFGGNDGESILPRIQAGVRRLSARVSVSPTDEDSKRLSLEAIEHFKHVLPQLNLDGVTGSFIGNNGDLALLLETVKVSVHPVVLLRKSVRGQERVGALLLVMGKKRTLSMRGGKAVATLLYEALTQRRLVVPPAVVDPKLCIVVDVFRGIVYTAPTHRARLMQEIRYACREIADRWNGIKYAA